MDFDPAERLRRIMLQERINDGMAEFTARLALARIALQESANRLAAIRERIGIAAKGRDDGK